MKEEKNYASNISSHANTKVYKRDPAILCICEREHECMFVRVWKCIPNAHTYTYALQISIKKNIKRKLCCLFVIVVAYSL